MSIRINNVSTKRDVVVCENVRIVHRNFSGRLGTYNKDGKRSFSVVLNESEAIALSETGYNVKIRQQDDGSMFAYLPVAVNYRHVPPKICRIANGKMILLEEDTVSTLDSADIENVDLIINGVKWDIDGRSGIKCYANEMYITVSGGYFDEKYSGYAFETQMHSDHIDDLY